MRWVDDIIDSVSMSFSKLWKIMKDREVWPAAVHAWGCKQLDMTWQLNNNK